MVIDGGTVAAISVGLMAFGWIVDKGISHLRTSGRRHVAQVEDHHKVVHLDGKLDVLSAEVKEVKTTMQNMQVGFAEYRGSNEASHLHVTQSLGELKDAVRRLEEKK